MADAARTTSSLLPEWIGSYRKEWLSADVVAGLTAAAVVIPNALAYATIAGLPIEVGLYTAFAPMVIYALLGTSRPLSVSSTTTLAILTGAQLAEIAAPDERLALLRASATLTLLVGAILVLAAILRLGFLANFISEPVLVGFKAGIGCVLILSQVPKLLGTHIEKTGFFRDIARVLRGLPGASVPTLAVGAATIAALLAFRRFLPTVPAPLIAVAAGIVGVKYLGFGSLGVAVVGHVSGGLPSPILPDLSLAELLWPGAVGIALMSFTETMAVGRAFARSDEPPLRPNRELLATGLGNAGGAFLGAMPGGGGTSQTAVNRGAGAWTQLAELVTAGITLLTMLFLAPLIGLMPQTTLAAVVIVSSLGLIKVAEFGSILRIRRMEFLWALAALGGVVLLGTLKGILVAIVVSIVGLAHQAADPAVRVLVRKRGTNVFRPRSKEHPDDESFPGLLLLRPEGRIFFVNTERLMQKVRALADEEKPAVVALDLGGVFDLEYTALKMLGEAEKRAAERGVSLWLVGLNPQALDAVNRSALGERLGRERMHFNLETAVRQYQAGS